MNWIRDNKALAGIGGVIGLAVVAFIAFGVLGIHTRFIDDTVDEAVPVFDSGAASDIASDVVDQATTDEMNEFMAEESTPSIVESDEAMPEASGESESGEVFTVAEGMFVDRSHPGSGDAIVITDGSDQRFLRFENFETDNGPDLFVYLTTARADANSGDFGVEGEFINLGRLKGNVGPQNYEIPVDANISEFATVVVWCDRFSVAFTAADLA